MLDDLRKNHDAHPSSEELGWMAMDPVTVATRALVLVGVSLMIGVLASYVVSPDEAPAAKVVASRTAASR
jgi:hypothetical protein